MKNVSIALLLLVAVAYVAQSEAAYCRHSSYKLPCKIGVAAKKAMFKACKLTTVKILGFKDFKNGCCQIRQRVPSQAVWDGYKVCEEKSKWYLKSNGKYASLQAAKAAPACKALAFSGKCK